MTISCALPMTPMSGIPSSSSDRGKSCIFRGSAIPNVQSEVSMKGLMVVKLYCSLSYWRMGDMLLIEGMNFVK